MFLSLIGCGGGDENNNTYSSIEYTEWINDSASYLETTELYLKESAEERSQSASLFMDLINALKQNADKESKAAILHKIEAKIERLLRKTNHEIKRYETYLAILDHSYKVTQFSKKIYEFREQEIKKEELLELQNKINKINQMHQNNKEIEERIKPREKLDTLQMVDKLLIRTKDMLRVISDSWGIYNY